MSNRHSILVALAGVWLLGSFHLAPASSQQAATTARAVIEAALSRLGGEVHLRSQRRWFIAGKGEENLTAELQGLTPDRPTIRPHEEWLGVDAELQAVAWERRTPRNDLSLRWRRFIYRADSTGVIVWTDSAGGMNPGAAPLARRRALMRRIPHLLLLEAAHAESLQLGAVSSIMGRRHREVRFRVEDGTWLSLWISADSSLLRRVEYRTTLPGRGEVTVQWRWHRWIADENAGLRPSGHEIVIDGRQYSRVDYQRFEVAAAAADSLLSVPNDVRSRRTAMQMPQSSDTVDVLPTTGEVAPGIHVEDVAGFKTLIIEFATFVVLVEAPAAAAGFEALPATREADRISRELSQRVRRIARGRSLGYTILTHHHSDHVGSAPVLNELSRAFLVPADAQRLIQSVIARAGRHKARVQAVRHTYTIRDSARTVIIYDVTSNPHSDHSLFVWLPQERIGFQGDLFYYDQGASAPPNDRRIINTFFARWLQQRGISPRAIYGVHSMGATTLPILRDAVH